MSKNEKYDSILSNSLQENSIMGVLASEKNFRFSLNQLEHLLASSSYFDSVAVKIDHDEEKTADSQVVTANIVYQGVAYQVSIIVEPTSNLYLSEFGFSNEVSKKEMEKALVQKEYLACSTSFVGSPEEGFLFQLKVLLAIVPSASIVVDFSSSRILSGDWLRLAAISNIPPSPSYLYSIHAVFEDDKEDNRVYWLHSHGLARCGCLEVEMVNISIGAKYLYDLIHVVANMFLKHTPNKNEEFSVGYDGLGIKLCWRLWEEAISEMPQKALGGIKNRIGADAHTSPSAVIFASQEGILCSPEIYISTLKEDPLLFVTNEEAQRMSLLAKERFVYFENVFADFGHCNGWRFLVKLGYPIENSTSASRKEHLWFELSGIEGNMLYAELLNKPYWVKQLKKGSKELHPASMLTDWVIYTPDSAGAYTPDNIYRYYQKHNGKRKKQATA